MRAQVAHAMPADFHSSGMRRGIMVVYFEYIMLYYIQSKILIVRLDIVYSAWFVGYIQH